VSTLAGSKSAGSSNGIGTQASFTFPHDVVISRSGAFAVTTEAGGHRVRFIDLVTLQVKTLAGSGNNTFADGQGTMASFSAPDGIAISPDDSFVLVIEGQPLSHRVRRIMIATGVVTTLAGNGTAGSTDGVGTLATFNIPRGIAISPDGAYALIADSQNIRVRRLDMVTRAVTTVAGSGDFSFADGTGTNAQFKGVFYLAIDPTGSYALICDFFNHRVRRLDIASLQVTTLAGSNADGFQDGFGTNSKFNIPYGVSIDPTGTYALISDYGNQRIRRILIATAQVTTLAGTGNTSAFDGVGAIATFSNVAGIRIDFSGAFALVADPNNNRIRRIALSSPPCSAGFYCPAGSSSATQLACPANGTFCPSGSSAPTNCGAGTFCAAVTGLSASTLCATGFFCANGAAFTVRGALDGQGMRVFLML
jgi:DNA-binding beta-propeller fold protein YncE